MMPGVAVRGDVADRIEFGAGREPVVPVEALPAQPKCIETHPRYNSATLVGNGVHRAQVIAVQVVGDVVVVALAVVDRDHLRTGTDVVLVGDSAAFGDLLEVAVDADARALKHTAAVVLFLVALPVGAVMEVDGVGALLGTA